MKEQFTEQDLMETLRTYLWPQYMKYSAIHGYVEFDDILQDCAIGWYEIMKSTGKPRLEHYNEVCESWKHVRNIVRLCTYQVIPNWMKSKHYQNRPLSLNQLMNESEGDGCEWIDMLASMDDEILVQLECKDILDCLDSNQVKIVLDLLAGNTKTFMRDKYKRFDSTLLEIQEKIKKYYESSGENLSIIF